MERIGLSFSGGLQPTDIVDCVQLADELGYESAWMAEGHGGDQFSILTACALKTKNILLGTSITSVFVRSAPTIAMAAAPVHSSTFRGRVFKPLMEEIGLKNVTPHDLRRYCGTELLALATKYGTDLEQVRQIMGHKDLSTTLNIYAQARPDYQERFLTLLANRNVA